MCVSLHMFVCLYMRACVCVCVRALPCKVGYIIFLLSVSVRYAFSKISSQKCFLAVNNFRLLKLAFHRSILIHSVRRKFSAFMEYVQCISRHHDTGVNVHH
jgi:hypothetical protein